MRILGAEKIHFAVEYLHPEFLEIVKYFEKQGIVETSIYKDPSGFKDLDRLDHQRWMFEGNTLNDCFYRVKNLYEYLVVMDFDEVVMPMNVKDMNWFDLNKRINWREDLDFVRIQMVRFPEVEISSPKCFPDYFYILQQRQREKKDHLISSPKCIIRTDTVKTVHTHRPLHCLRDKFACNHDRLSPEIGVNNHYRSNGSSKLYKKILNNETKTDDTVLKFKDQLIKAVEETLKETGFKP